jgi:hypothetical protein
VGVAEGLRVVEPGDAAALPAVLEVAVRTAGIVLTGVAEGQLQALVGEPLPGESPGPGALVVGGVGNAPGGIRPGPEEVPVHVLAAHAIVEIDEAPLEGVAPHSAASIDPRRELRAVRAVDSGRGPGGEGLVDPPTRLRETQIDRPGQAIRAGHDPRGTEDHIDPIDAHVGDQGGVLVRSAPHRRVAQADAIEKEQALLPGQAADVGTRLSRCRVLDDHPGPMIDAVQGGAADRLIELLPVVGVVGVGLVERIEGEPGRRDDRGLHRDRRRGGVVRSGGGIVRGCGVRRAGVLRSGEGWVEGVIPVEGGSEGRDQQEGEDSGEGRRGPRRHRGSPGTAVGKGACDRPEGRTGPKDRRSRGRGKDERRGVCLSMAASSPCRGSSSARRPARTSSR